MDKKDENIVEFGQAKTGDIFLMSIIGKVGGPDCL